MNTLISRFLPRNLAVGQRFMPSPNVVPTPWSARLEGLLTRDYLPQVNPYIRWMWRPLGALGLAAFASVLCGVFLHPQAFLLAFGLVAALGVGTIWPWLSVKGLRGSLGFDTLRAREGEPISASLSIRNRLPWGCWGVAIRGGPADFVGLAHVPGWRTTERRFTITAEVRGAYPSSPITLSSGFPFGFWEPARRLNVERPLLIWPRTYPVGPIPASAGHRAMEGTVAIDRPGDSGDFAGVRPYRRGDSLRSVHWPQTARYGHLIVCERQSLSLPWIQVVIDANPDVHEGHGPNGSREWAIRIAASFLERWLDEGARMEAVLGRDVLLPRAGGEQKRKALDMLARLSDVGPSLEDALKGSACKEFGGGLRVVVTTDLGLARLSSGAARDPASRFVVLQTRGFTEESTSLASPVLSIAPWIVIDGPDGVPHRLKSAWKEGPRAR